MPKIWVINTATIYDEEAINIMKYISDNGLSVSHYFHLNEIKNEDEIEIQTICGTTIDGILLNEKIPSQPLYGGLLKIKDYHPDKFTELISYKKTSITPLHSVDASAANRAGQGLHKQRRAKKRRSR